MAEKDKLITKDDLFNSIKNIAKEVKETYGKGQTHSIFIDNLLKDLKAKGFNVDNPENIRRLNNFAMTNEFVSFDDLKYFDEIAPVSSIPVAAKGEQGLIDTYSLNNLDDNLQIKANKLNDKQLYDEFITYLKITSEAEKPNDKITQNLLNQMPDADWKEFSKARGYSPEEIKDFERYLELANEMEKRFPGKGDKASLAEQINFQYRVEDMKDGFVTIDEHRKFIDTPLPNENVIDFREKQLEKLMKEVEDATPDVTKITSSQAEMIDNALADAAANLRRGTFEALPGGKGALTKAIKTRLVSILGDGLNVLDVYELGLLLGAVGQPALDPIVKIIFPDAPDDNRPYKERVLENIQRVEKISPTAKAVKKISEAMPEPDDTEYTIYGVPSNRAVQFTSMYGMLGGNNGK